MTGGINAQLIDEQRQPITVYSDNIIVSCDWHIPFVDNEMVALLLEIADEYEVNDLAIIGDFFDCDNLSKFTKLTNLYSFDEECDLVGQYLRMLVDRFPGVYICRGNHEKRWIDILGGCTSIDSLFALSKVTNGYRLTLDDNINLKQNDDTWLLCHPKNYRMTPLSVVRDLAAIHGCNVLGAHGHQLAQGKDRSGRYHCLDGGGLFDKYALDYLRETTTHPETIPGFYLIQDGTAIPFTLKGSH